MKDILNLRQIQKDLLNPEMSRERSKEIIKKLIVLRSILIDILNEKFIMGKDNVPIFTRRINTVNQRSSTARAFEDNHLYQVLLSVLASSIIVAPPIAINASGISAAIAIPSAIFYVAYTYINEKHQLINATKPKKVGELIDLINVILGGNMPIEETTNPKYINTEEDEEAFKKRQEEAQRRGLTGRVGGYTKKRKAKKSKSTRRR